jgi:2,5-dioxopentanoate dehydrogenase
MTQHKDSYIAGQWVANDGESFDNFNPVKQEVIDTYQSAGNTLISSACTAAVNAYQTYRNFSGEQIAQFLQTLADEIEALGDELLNTADAETGLGLVRLTGERGRTTNQIRAFAQVAKKGEWVSASIDTAIADRTPPKPDLRRVMRPLGPVLVFPASNFPLAFGVLGGDTASALAAGNPVVIKAHPAHPATSALMAQAMHNAVKKCNVPAGVFSMLQGTSLELAQTLVKHDAFEAIGFTGSLRAGRAIMDLAAQRPKPIPVYAEMGSINPIFITPDAQAARGETIAADLAASVCMGTGQFCTSPGIVVGHNDEKFVEALASSLSSAAKGTLLHPSIASGLSTALSSAQASGKLELVTGGNTEENSLTPENTLFVTSADNFINNPDLHHEIFGPACIYVSCEDQSQILAVARSLGGQLTATVHSDVVDDDVKELLSVIEDCSGRVLFNGYPTGVEVCPSQQHGGPYPACSVSSSTSVGEDAISRFGRFVAYQNAPDELLPDALKQSNPLNIYRLVNGKLQQGELS